MEPKTLERSAAGTVNKIGRGIRVKKKEIIQYICCGLGHRGCDFNTNMLTYSVTVSQHVIVCVCVSG